MMNQQKLDRVNRIVDQKIKTINNSDATPQELKLLKLLINNSENNSTSYFTDIELSKLMNISPETIKHMLINMRRKGLISVHNERVITVPDVKEIIKTTRKKVETMNGLKINVIRKQTSEYIETIFSRVIIDKKEAREMVDYFFGVNQDLDLEEKHRQTTLDGIDVAFKHAKKLGIATQLSLSRKTHFYIVPHNEQTEIVSYLMGVLEEKVFRQQKARTLGARIFPSE